MSERSRVVRVDFKILDWFFHSSSDAFYFTRGDLSEVYKFGKDKFYYGRDGANHYIELGHWVTMGERKQFTLEDYRLNLTLDDWEEVITRETFPNTTYDEVQKDLRETYISKNKDYGDSFTKSLDEFGAVAGIVRIGDKFERIKQLTKSGEQKVKDETIQDTVEDMANYCIMLAAWFRQRKEE